MTASARFRASIDSDGDGEVIVLLLTFVHPSLPGGELRLSSDNKVVLDGDSELRGTISRGEAYGFMPMDVTLPEDGDRVTPVLQVVINGVGTDIAPVLNQVRAPISVVPETVLASAPDLVDVSYGVFEMTSSDISGEMISLSLIVDALASEPYPAPTFTPSGFPGLWSAY